MRYRILVMVAFLMSSPPATAVAQQPAAGPQCNYAGSIVKVPDLPEASGIAMSRRVPGRLWAHNDSGEPVLFALDRNGKVIGRLRLPGANVDDWEAIAVGPCPAGSCFYVADIGDNNARRKRITVYRAAEPADAAESAPVTDAFHATYPDGPRDAETLLIAPDGRLHVVTKGADGAPIAVYRFPRDPQPGSVVELERVGKLREARTPSGNDRITDGSVSPDGTWVVLRGHHTLTFYRAEDLLAGNWREARRVDLAHLKEPRGEGVTLGADNTVYLAGEGGWRSRGGTFARLTCAAQP